MTTDAPSRSADLRSRVRAALLGQNSGKERPETVTVLSSLLAVQDDMHYVPVEGIEEIAEYCESTVNDVWSVASFYTNFRFTPPGRATIDVCWGPSCHVMGAQAVMRAVHEVTGIEGEETSADGKVTIRYSTCLAACAHAPVIARDHALKGNVTPESAREYVEVICKELDSGNDH